jgi:hypothetical protein
MRRFPAKTVEAIMLSTRANDWSIEKNRPCGGREMHRCGTALTGIWMLCKEQESSTGFAFLFGKRHFGSMAYPTGLVSM